MRRAPAWRFHESCIDGKVVLTDEELDRLDGMGWKDHPGKVRLLPGHEKVWEEEMSAEVYVQETSKFDERDITPPGTHQCKLCGREFSTMRELNYHGVITHSAIEVEIGEGL
jgi:hypothetical protein